MKEHYNVTKKRCIITNQDSKAKHNIITLQNNIIRHNTILQSIKNMLHHYKITQQDTKQYCNIQNNAITLQKSIVILQKITIHETTLQHTKLHCIPYNINLIILQNDIPRQTIVL